MFKGLEARVAETRGKKGGAKEKMKVKGEPGTQSFKGKMRNHLILSYM